MKSRKSTFFKVFIFVVPFFFGVVGLAFVEGDSFLDSVFSTLMMFFLNYGDSPPNVFVEIARWTAPLATASGFILIIRSLHGRLMNRLIYLRGDSVAVYGSPSETEPILKQLGKRGIKMNDSFLKAHRYILMGQENENFDYYKGHLQDFSSHMVYLKCDSLKAQSVSHPNLKLFCSEETAARIFWKKRRLYGKAVEHDFRMKVVFIGFGRLGEEALTYALQNNIFSPEQRIEYHVFGGDERFSSIHTQLSEIEDPVVFHREPWYASLSLLEEADMVLVLSQEEQLTLLKDLLFATVRSEIDVFADDCVGAELLSDSQRLNLFDWKAHANKLEHIFSDTLIDRAKRINLRYASLYGNVKEGEEAKDTEWKKLDAFTRYSNISAADYHEVRLVMLETMGQVAEPDQIPDQLLEQLAHLEHIRWCRYHWLNNWQYGVPLDGKNKSISQRIHRDLVEYEELTDGEKEKDRENIRVLLSVK